MKEFSWLRAKIINDGNEDKEKKVQKNLIKRKLKYENYKNCLEAN